ncbi:MAG TPA: zinc metallopeptidase [Verrucomicrobiae bacterium]|nr:zinc metallopeptidase [Verrucomicrobiae bacterium]
MTLAMLILDQWWWLIVPGIVLGLYAQFRLTSTYGHYSRIANRQGLTGEQAARAVLDSAGLRQMPIYEVDGQLTDHYDPLKKALFLSSDNFHSSSIAAIGVAAHEAGHALQHKAAYTPLHLRMALVPVTQIASNAAIWLSFGGFFLGFAKLAMVGIVIYSIIAFFQLVTLPVEYDASRRAKIQLLNLGLVDGQESQGVKRVLSAAALTYVAGLASTLLVLLHFFLMARNDRN